MPLDILSETHDMGGGTVIPIAFHHLVTSQTLNAEEGSRTVNAPVQDVRRPDSAPSQTHRQVIDVS